MERWNEIRQKALVDNVSKRELRRQYRLGAETLEKILSHSEPPGYRTRYPRNKTKIGPFLAIIDQILADDVTAPPKQRHTSRRITDRLRSEYGYEGGRTQVYEYVATFKRHQREVYMSLTQDPGHAQYDFGEATVVIAGVECKAALSVMTLPYSDAWHMSAYPRECTETFQAGHVAAFAFFGGVPIRTSYDNSKIAVTKITGPNERELTREFLRLRSHHLFKSHFCHVARGNEKGHVEGLVGYGRRNTLVPVPEFASWRALNEYLEACCYADLFRRVRGNAETKIERLEADRAALRPIPVEPFEYRMIAQTKSSSLSLVRFDCNDYSVPTKFAHHDVTAIGAIEEVTLVVGSEVVATHPRVWTKEVTTYDPIHYLALLAKKPGSLDYAKPLENWGLPECFSVLRRRLENEAGSEGTREFIKVLLLLENASIAQLTRAIKSALAIGAMECNTIRLLILNKTEKPVSLFCLDGHPHLKEFTIDPPDLGAYRALTKIGANT